MSETHTADGTGLPEEPWASMQARHAGAQMFGIVPSGHTVRTTKPNELVICFEDGSAFRRVMTPAEQRFWAGVSNEIKDGEEARARANKPPNGDQGNENQGEHDGIEGP